jgi:phage shock protein C
MEKQNNTSNQDNLGAGDPKRLYRSRTNRVFAGICGGIGDYFNVDPVPIRLIWLIVTIFTGVVPGLLAYLIAVFLVPERKI